MVISAQDPAAARRLWHAVEPLHALVYFAPDVRLAMKAVGMKGFWMGYFAGRASALGPVPAEVVTAAFFNFHPRMVARAIPDAWSVAPSDVVLTAWFDAAVTALRQLVGAETHAATEAATLLRAACDGLDCAGRPLAAAWAGVPWRDEPLADLWLGTTVLREHRGDGHVAALVAEGVSGAQAHVLAAAEGLAPRESLQPNRGWSDEEWSEAETSLRGRGWLDEDGRLTDAGAEARTRIEATTDRLATAPLRALGEPGLSRLLELTEMLTALVHEAGVVTYPNPIGLPRP